MTGNRRSLQEGPRQYCAICFTAKKSQWHWVAKRTRHPFYPSSTFFFFFTLLDLQVSFQNNFHIAFWFPSNASLSLPNKETACKWIIVHHLLAATGLMCYINIWCLMDTWCLFSLGTSVVCMQNGGLIRWCNSAAVGFTARAALVPR